MRRVQASAGNAAVQRMLSGGRLARQVAPPLPVPPVLAPPTPAAPPVPGAVTQHTPAEIKAMTLEAFDGFAKGQADWALDPGLGAEVDALRGVLEFARAKEGGLSLVLGGCKKMTVQALLDTGLDAAARDDLRFYSRGVMQPPEHPTVKLTAIDDIGKARIYGQTLRKLEAVPGGVTIKKIFNQTEALDRLMAAAAVDSFIAYCTAASPTLQAEDPNQTSPEITSPATPPGTRPSSVRSPTCATSTASSTTRSCACSRTSHSRPSRSSPRRSRSCCSCTRRSTTTARSTATPT
jgi:hypothetical protein